MKNILILIVSITLMISFAGCKSKEVSDKSILQEDTTEVTPTPQEDSKFLLKTNLESFLKLVANNIMLNTIIIQEDDSNIYYAVGNSISMFNKKTGENVVLADSNINSIDCLKLNNDVLYFVANMSELYKYDIKNREKTVIKSFKDASTLKIDVSNNYIYYMVTYSMNMKSQLGRIPAGSLIEETLFDIPTDKALIGGKFFVSGNSLYYQLVEGMLTEGGIFKHDLNSKEQTQLHYSKFEDKLYKVYTKGYFGKYKESIYAVDKQSQNLFTVNENTAEVKTILEDRISSVFIKDNKIYFINESDSFRLYCSNLDGSDLVSIDKDGTQSMRKIILDLKDGIGFINRQNVEFCSWDDLNNSK